jgi:hypothetical protein
LKLGLHANSTKILLNIKKCDDCEYHDECVDNAEDNRDGYELFEEIVSDAYGSVEAFWECNGI